MPSTISLNLSQRLAKLGVNAPSEWYHYQFLNREMGIDRYDGIHLEGSVRETWNRNARWEKICPAYTTDDLLGLLKHITVEKHLTFYRVTENQETGKIIQNESLVEALGLLAAYLKENKII